MADIKYTTVTTGPNASMFHDPITGITVINGTNVKLRPNQVASPRVKQALASGHLVMVIESNSVDSNKVNEEDLEKLDKKIKNKFDKGVTVEKLASSIDLETAKLLASKNEITVEENDTVVDILNAILTEE